MEIPLNRTTRGWLKPSQGAKYAGVSLKIFRRWLNSGLRHVRLENGRIFTNFDYIDEYLMKHEATDSAVKDTAEEILSKL
jgi:predicted site-specific integrase-resolvase